jgi:DNA-binding XRE family transcriptional regulator
MARTSGYSQQPSRPLSITLIAWGTFLLGLANGWRAVGLNRQSSILIELEVVPDPRLRLAIALAWAIVFLVLAGMLWFRRRLTRWAIPGLVAVYSLYQMALTVLFFRSPDAARGWPLTVLLSLMVVVGLTWFLNRAANRWYFEVSG